MGPLMYEALRCRKTGQAFSRPVLYISLRHERFMAHHHFRLLSQRRVFLGLVAHTRLHARPNVGKYLSSHCAFLSGLKRWRREGSIAYRSCIHY